MKLERISLTSPVGPRTQTVELTSGLTIVEAGAGETTSLVDRLAGALSTGEDGVHVELALDEGSGLVAFRPHGSAHRVIDLARGEDVSNRHGRAGGGVDLLAPWRTEGPALERELASSGADLASPDPTDAWMNQLAAVDPDQLLSTAEAEIASEQSLRRATATARAAPDDARAASRLAAARQRRAKLEGRLRRLRLATILAAVAGLVATVIGFATVGVALGVILGVVSVVVVAGCFLAERRLRRSLAAEDAAVRNAASRATARPTAPSPSSPVSNRATVRPVATSSPRPAAPLRPPAFAARTTPDEAGGSLANDRHPGANGTTDRGLEVPPNIQGSASPGSLTAAAEHYQSSSASWQRLAGNVPAAWVLDQRDRIRATARLRSAVAPEAGAGSENEGGSGARPTSLMDAITNRAASLSARTGGETLPLLLDEPLAGLDWADKVPVLEFLGRLARHQQVVVVTADPEVVSWARLEAMAGSLRLTALAAGADGDDGAEGNDPAGGADAGTAAGTGGVLDAECREGGAERDPSRGSGERGDGP